MKNPSTSNKSQTNWKRLDSMTDDDIDTSDIPPITPEMFARAVVKRGLKGRDSKAQLTIRVDKDVLNWFKARGRGYQTQINALLRAYMEASKSARR
ncbi:MAG: BrnA antitoxin family protein [Anaerolineales bacterium]|nr:BrnA antitoxin family protein [Anaerolineales bacterium]